MGRRKTVAFWSTKSEEQIWQQWVNKKEKERVCVQRKGIKCAGKKGDWVLSAVALAVAAGCLRG